NLNKETPIYAPITPQYLKIQHIPHPLFPQKIIPQPFPINPTQPQLLSPIHPNLHNLFPTKHPIALKPQNPLELLLH
ncbi:PTS glucose transporter subunit IIA, partial [Staphylococcus saprophyticus]|uniref:PTS glucose transporter subunit IIA n=1 Tax=Staphylococcus saprophyticus TaxID=29385 RepID=UPI0016434762